MTEVGVRELKRDLSGYLKRAAAGEKIRVTLRGEAVVDLVPVESISEPVDELRAHFERLAAEGKVTLSPRPWGERDFTVRDLGLRHSPFEALMAERDADYEREA